MTILSVFFSIFDHSALRAHACAVWRVLKRLRALVNHFLTKRSLDKATFLGRTFEWEGMAVMKIKLDAQRQYMVIGTRALPLIFLFL